MRWLEALEHVIGAHADEFCNSIASDFGWRSPHETRLLEILPSLDAIRFARSHLDAWMAPEPRQTSRWFLTSKASVHYEPLGVVGIVAPWNYALYLAVAPLAGALAAGNRVMIKPSGLSSATSRLMQRLLASVFESHEVCVTLGGTDVGREFVRLPFDHLLFTGSAAVGREVLVAASANLTPVTLELGGKSPAIIAPGYPLAHAAQRIMFGKCLNAGQTCIAPDYVLVPEGTTEKFVQEAGRAAQELYPDPLRSPDYSAVINQHHYARLMSWLEQAKQSGAQAIPLVPGSAPDPQTRRIPPIAVIGAAEDCAIMREEIFGPVLPIIPCPSIDEAIDYVSQRVRPLALYYFDQDRGRIDDLLRRTKAGGVTINDVLFHIAQDDLPFGGVGASGMGRYHGREGFKTFSNAKGVLHQSKWAPATWLHPPWSGRVDRIIRFLTSG